VRKRDSHVAAAAPSLRTWALICLVSLLSVGLVAWDYLISNPLALFSYAMTDLLVMALLIVTRVIRNELILLFCALSLLYSHSFLFEAVIGLSDPESFAIVINLTIRGLDLIADSCAVMLAAILFRLAALVGAWSLTGRAQGVGERLAATHFSDVVIIAFVAVAATIVGLATSISIVILLGVNLSIAAIGLIAVVVARKFGFGLVAIFLVLICSAVLLLATGRSRLPIMVVAICLLVVYFSRSQATIWTAAALGGFVLVIFLMFGYLREAVGDRGVRDASTGVLSLEETGNMHLVGAHIVGLSSRGELPGALHESLLSKFLRSIPGANRPMLADRYVEEFFAEVADAGGGFAFPAVAEWYAAGGRLGDVAAGLLLGFVAAVLAPRLRSGYALCMAFVFVAQFFRQEIAASLLTIVTLLAGSGVLLASRQVLILGSQPVRE
jgi:hypothetical protein